MANTPNINLVKPLGTDKALVSVINDNSEKIDAFAGSVNTNMAKTQDGFAIVVNGNNAPKAISAGQYLFIKNHSTLSAGGYHATANIANGAAITSSNVAADADGVVNGAFAALNSKLSVSTPSITNESTITSGSTVSARECANVVTISADVTTDTTATGYVTIATCEKHPHTNEYITWIDTNGNTKMGRLTMEGDLQIHNPANNTNYMAIITFVATN